MKTIKVIDLLNKIANGEINEDIEIEYQNGYNFEYCDIRNFFDRYIVDKENLNQEINLVKSLEEKKLPEKILGEPRHIYNENELYIVGKVNAIIDYLENK